MYTAASVINNKYDHPNWQCANTVSVFIALCRSSNINTSSLASSSKTVVVLLSLADAADAGGDMVVLIGPISSGCGVGINVNTFLLRSLASKDESLAAPHSLRTAHPLKETTARFVHGPCFFSVQQTIHRFSLAFFESIPDHQTGEGSVTVPEITPRLPPPCRPVSLRPPAAVTSPGRLHD